jgi:hypothetical protein
LFTNGGKQYSFNTKIQLLQGVSLSYAQIFCMNWELLLLLSLFGLIIGILSVNGYTQKIEPLIWLLSGMFSAFILARNVSSQIFLYGVALGLVWGILNGLIQSIFFERYLEKNPKYKDAYNKKMPVQPRFFVLLAGPVIGLLTGAAVGGLAILFQKYIL